MKFIYLQILVIMSTTMMIGQIDRTKRPEPGSALPLRLPEIQRSTLENGLKIMLVEDHELPVVQMNLVILSGTSDDPASKGGLSNLTAQMVDEGTGKRDALQIAEDVEYLGASVSVTSGMDGTFATLLTLKEHLAAAMEIYADILLNPTFPQKEWDRVKATHLTSLMQQKDQPGTVASKVFNMLTYGSDHPYGRPSNGTEGSVNSITTDDLRGFYSAHYRPNNATVIVVGDVTLNEMKAMLQGHFGSWAPGEMKESPMPSAPGVSSTRIFLVNKPEAAQSEVRIGHVGVARNSPDYFALTVMNTILGGQFSSRINMNLREAKGYTYGARSGFSMWKSAGPFIASGAVKTGVTDSSVAEFMKELKLIRDADITEQELQFAKSSLTLREPLRFETPQQIAGQLQSLVLYDLPDDYFSTYVQNFDKITRADVRRVAEKYLQPSAMNIVIVGDVATVKDGLAHLGYGDVRMLDAEGGAIQ